MEREQDQHFNAQAVKELRRWSELPQTPFSREQRRYWSRLWDQTKWVHPGAPVPAPQGYIAREERER